MSEDWSGDGSLDADSTGRGGRTDPESIAERIAQATDGDEIKRLLVSREAALGRSVEDIADEFGWSERQVEDWLVGTTDDHQSGDGGAVRAVRRLREALEPPLMTEMVIVLLLTALLVAVLQPGLVVGLRMGMAGTYVGLMAEPVPVSDRAELSIGTEDVAYLNRIFEEQDAEVGYCGLIDAEGSLRPWLAQLGDPTVSSVELSTENCPTGRYAQVALLHTHPSGDPRLSAADRASLRVSGVDYVCVQHRRITASVGETTSNLRCYRDGGDGRSGDGLRRVPVRRVG